jgi:adenine phosphoribosyltransferase
VDLREYVRDIPDFPQPGIVFKDITPLLLDPSAIGDGTRVLLHDDLIATGGTAVATGEAIERPGGPVAGCSFLIELAFLGGRDRLAGDEFDALLSYSS